MDKHLMVKDNKLPGKQPKEILHIHSFLGFRNLKLELNQFNILIGGQATGKSILSTLLYFFKSVSGDFCLEFKPEDELSIEKSIKQLEMQFQNHFPPGIMPKGEIFIEFFQGDLRYSIEGEGTKQIRLEIPEIFEQITKEIQLGYRDSFLNNKMKLNRHVIHPFSKINALVEPDFSCLQCYIPAKRLYFTGKKPSHFNSRSAIGADIIEETFLNNHEFNLEKWNDFPLDDPKFFKYSSKILSGEFSVENEEVITHSDGRKVPLRKASSGQQEASPLILSLAAAIRLHLDHKLRTTMYIEEPEAHLFPASQRQMVELMAYTFQKTHPDLQLFITTHSPFILSVVNNLLQKGMNLKSGSKAAGQVFLPPGDVSAYSLSNWKLKKIIDKETGLIDMSLISKVSGEILQEFQELLEIESSAN